MNFSTYPLHLSLTCPHDLSLSHPLNPPPTHPLDPPSGCKTTAMLLIRMPDERVKLGNKGFCEMIVKLLEKYQLANDDNIAGQVDRYLDTTHPSSLILRIPLYSLNSFSLLLPLVHSMPRCTTIVLFFAHDTSVFQSSPCFAHTIIFHSSPCFASPI